MQQVCNAFFLALASLGRTFVSNQTLTDMKKRFALLLLAVAAAPVFAQDMPKAGDIIYGTVIDSVASVDGIIVVEMNSNKRIMAQTTTDINGNYSFRMVDPNDDVVFYRNAERLRMVSKTSVLPMTGLPYDIDLNAIADADELKGQEHQECEYIRYYPIQDYYLPFRDFIHYRSIEDLFNNMFFYF